MKRPVGAVGKQRQHNDADDPKLKNGVEFIFANLFRKLMQGRFDGEQQRGDHRKRRGGNHEAQRRERAEYKRQNRDEFRGGAFVRPPNFAAYAVTTMRASPRQAPPAAPR